MCRGSHAERGALGSPHTEQGTAASFHATRPPEGPVYGVHPHQNSASPGRKQKAREERPSRRPGGRSERLLTRAGPDDSMVYCFQRMWSTGSQTPRGLCCACSRDPQTPWRVCKAALSPCGSCLSCPAVTSSKWKRWGQSRKSEAPCKSRETVNSEGSWSGSTVTYFSGHKCNAECVGPPPLTGLFFSQKKGTWEMTRRP